MNRRRMWVGLAAAVAGSGCAVTVDAGRLAPPAQRRVLKEQLSAPLGYALHRAMLPAPNGGRLDVAFMTRADAAGTIIYSGGRGFRMDDSSRRAARLAELTGADVVMFDYPGRGASEGRMDAAFVSAFAPHFLDAMRAGGRSPVAPLIAYGFSFGGVMAAQFAAFADGVVIEASSDDSSAILEAVLPAPMRPLVAVRVDAGSVRYAEALAAARKPIMVLAGGADRIAPENLVRAFADKLAAAGADVRFAAAPGARHGEALYGEAGGAALRDFLRREGPSTTAPDTP